MEKRNINELYNQKILLEKYNYNFNKDIFNKYIEQFINNINKDLYLELSTDFSFDYNFLLDYFKEGYFLSDDPFNSLLVYHNSILSKKNLNVLNYNFDPNRFINLKMNEKFDFIYSNYGLNFNDLYNLLPQIIGFAKVGGIISIIIPSYWFFHSNLTLQEKDILDYSKKNDKKWIFIESIEPLISQNNGEILFFKNIEYIKKLNRLELANLASLNKLYNAEIENNKAILDIINIPKDNIQLNSCLLVIKKKNKTLTKDNLFNF